MKKFFIFGVLFVLGTALFAQSAESDFTVTANNDGTVTITKYEGWDSTVTVPATIGGKAVTAIGKEAFAKQENLSSVTIPDSVTSIGDSAFANNKLTTVTFGKRLESIGEKAFYDNSLTNLTLPDTIKSIGKRAFSHNLLARITIPGFNTYIGAFAFARNKQLTSVTLGSFFTFANGSAYDGDSSGGISFTSFIEDDREPYSRSMDTNDIGERGKNLFWDYVCNDRKAGIYTPDLKYRAPKKDGDFEYIETKFGAALTGYNGTAASIQIPEKAGGLVVKYLHTSTFENKTVERVRIPNGVTSIGDRAFSKKDLTSVTIPDSVTYIGDDAFMGELGRSKLTSVTLGKDLVIIRPWAFYNQKLTSVVIPDSVTYIGVGAFNDNNLTNVTIGNSVTYIGDRVFSGNNLTSVTIPDSVISIGDSDGDPENGAFYNNNLTSVTIGNNVTYIGSAAFSRNNLTSVTIPDSVISIGYRAFSDNELTSITIGSGVLLGSNAVDYDGYYNENGKKAGVYTRESAYSDKWTYAER
ncbi:hypothetical protein FACS189445_6360 [Spirochaetia bacterium]|nr:hypothetical protein FACS189445_6360 [Spirochaetia bacterium]